jgi:hypothetical protein
MPVAAPHWQPPSQSQSRHRDQPHCQRRCGMSDTAAVHRTPSQTRKVTINVDSGSDWSPAPRHGAMTVTRLVR